MNNTIHSSEYYQIMTKKFKTYTAKVKKFQLIPLVINVTFMIKLIHFLLVISGWLIVICCEIKYNVIWKFCYLLHYHLVFTNNCRLAVDEPSLLLSCLIENSGCCTRTTHTGFTIGHYFS